MSNKNSQIILEDNLNDFSFKTNISSSILFVEFLTIAIEKIKENKKRVTKNFFIIFHQNSQYLKVF